MLEAILAVPCQKLRMGPILQTDRRHREARAIDEGTNAIRIVRLAGNQDLKIISEANQASVKHPMCGS